MRRYLPFLVLFAVLSLPLLSCQTFVRLASQPAAPLVTAFPQVRPETRNPVIAVPGVDLVSLQDTLVQIYEQANRGVVTAIYTESFSYSGQPVNSGLGFAVSINIVKRVVP